MIRRIAASGTQGGSLPMHRAAASSAYGCRLVGLVQAPLLVRLGAPEAARLPRLQLASELEGDRSELEGDWDELECLLAAAELARRGRQHGSQHGCVLIEEMHPPSDQPPDPLSHSSRPRRRLLGQGWNHAYIGRDQGKRTSRHVHAEAHAVADAIRRCGEPPDLVPRLCLDAYAAGEARNPVRAVPLVKYSLEPYSVDLRARSPLTRAGTARARPSPPSRGAPRSSSSWWARSETPIDRRRVEGCANAWMHGCMDARMSRCMDAWMHGCMGGWMRGCVCLSTCMSLSIQVGYETAHPCPKCEDM